MNGNGAHSKIDSLIANANLDSMLQSVEPVSTSAAGHIYPQPEKETAGSFLEDTFRFATSLGVDTGELDWRKLPLYLIGLGLTVGGGGKKGPSSMFSEGLKSKGLMPLGKSDLTKAIAWKNYPKGWPEGSSRGVKAYHGTPYKPIESDLKAGVHIGSPGAAIDRLADKVTWSEKYGDVASGFVHGVELYPKKPFTKLSPDFEVVVRDILEHPRNQALKRIDVERYLDEVRTTTLDPAKLGSKAILSEAGFRGPSTIEKEILSALDLPYARKKLTDLGYDVVPYENAFEGIGSISFNVINPKKARLNLIDEVYTVERPFRRSGDIKSPPIEAILDPRNAIETLEDLIRATRFGTK